MADFNISVKDTLVHEGININMGYVNDPTDRGGETIAGIARKFHPNDPIWTLVDNAKKGNFPQNLKDIPNILDGIKAFYKSNYWDKVCGDGVEVKVLSISIVPCKRLWGKVWSSYLLSQASLLGGFCGLLVRQMPQEET